MVSPQESVESKQVDTSYSNPTFYFCIYAQ
jgi:hypothetical protein